MQHVLLLVRELTQQVWRDVGDVGDLRRDPLLLCHDKGLIGDCLLLQGGLVGSLVHSLVLDGLIHMGRQACPNSQLGAQLWRPLRSWPCQLSSLALGCLQGSSHCCICC